MSGAWDRGEGVDPTAIPNTDNIPVTVDSFRHHADGAVLFLSHFHADHYNGLNERWRGPAVYTGATTANLVGASFPPSFSPRCSSPLLCSSPTSPNQVTDILSVPAEHVHALPMNEWTRMAYVPPPSPAPSAAAAAAAAAPARSAPKRSSRARPAAPSASSPSSTPAIPSYARILSAADPPPPPDALVFEVQLISAHHCPGAVCFLFRFSDGKVVLHTGDCRATAAFRKQPALTQTPLEALFLDTTYADAKYAFPSQQTVVDFVASTVAAIQQADAARGGRTLCLIATYNIGKEKILLATAQRCHTRLLVSERKYRMLHHLDLGVELDTVVRTDDVDDSEQVGGVGGYLAMLSPGRQFDLSSSSITSTLT